MSDLKKIGALWKNKGEGYSGEMELEEGTKQRIVLFKNGFKESDKHPDLVLYLSAEERKAPPTRKPAGRKPKREAPEPEPPPDDDIPF